VVSPAERSTGGFSPSSVNGPGLGSAPALGGLIGAVFGVAGIGALIGEFVTWVVERVLAQDQSTT
jgi:hypothetical protein